MTATPFSIPTDYNGRTFRSSFEADTARALDCGGFLWDYEPQSFLLADGTHYWPDFLVHHQRDGSPCRIWLECRGYVSEKGETQIRSFAKQLKPDESFAVLRPGAPAQWYTADGANGRTGAFFSARLNAYSTGNGEAFDKASEEITACRETLAQEHSESAQRELLRRMTELARFRDSLFGSRGAA